MKRRSPSTTTSSGGPPTGSGSPFPYADYVQAKQDLQRSLRRGPRFYGLVWGLSGMGKTCLLRDIAGDLDRHRHQIVYVSSSNASVVGIVRFLAQTLHVSPRRSYLETVHVLSDAIRAQAAQLLLWIDEADQMEAATLQEVRMLVESDLGSEPLATVVFSGLPPLLAHLDAPALFPLKRRVTLRCPLAGLRRDELDPFLDHRFGGTDARRIPTSVRDELFERTQATPALIDTVIRHALARQSGPLDAEHVRAVLDTHGL
jgi:type II secretory pathway predicted ATPase ExeA